MHRTHRPLALAFACLVSTLALILGCAQTAQAAHIFIDAGHGGRDPGAVNHKTGAYEKTVNLQIAQRLRAELERRGHKVTLSRMSDSTTLGVTDRPTWNYNTEADTWAFAKDGLVLPASTKDGLQERCDLANASGADLFISIHNNSAVSTAATGYETYSTSEDRLGALLAKHVHQEVVESVPLSDRGAKSTGFYVIRWSHMPAMLAECGFMSNDSDLAYISSATGQTTLARAIADGVDAFLASDPFKRYWPRIAGDDRYSTAAALSRDGWPNGADTVLIATGENWPDALASAPLSRSLDAPLLLTRSNSLPPATAAELARLSPGRIVVLGGTGAVEEAVAAAAARAAGISSGATSRIEGIDRYETAARIAAEVGVPPDGRVCVVTGTSPADAVSISAYAGARTIPILLAEPSSMGTATTAFAEANDGRWRSTLVIGGTGVIGEDLVATLPSPVRLAGVDRYGTNADILRRLYTWGNNYYVANGEAYPDCLAAGVRASKSGASLLLVKPRTLSERTREYIENHESRIVSVTMIGGTGPLPYLHDWMIDKALR